MVYARQTHFCGILWQPSVVLCTNMLASVDSVDRNALWLLLRSLGIPPKLVDMFKDLYTDTVSCVRLEDEVLSLIHI